MSNQQSKHALNERAYKDRRQAAGLRQIKIWVHPEEATRVREFAADQPMTKQLLNEVKK